MQESVVSHNFLSVADFSCFCVSVALWLALVTVPSDKINNVGKRRTIYTVLLECDVNPLSL